MTTDDYTCHDPTHRTCGCVKARQAAPYERAAPYEPAARITEAEADAIFAEADDIAMISPTAGAYRALLPDEADYMIAFGKERRMIADDVHDRDDMACARTHLARMREISAELFGSEPLLSLGYSREAL